MSLWFSALYAKWGGLCSGIPSPRTDDRGVCACRWVRCERPRAVAPPLPEQARLLRSHRGASTYVSIHWRLCPNMLPALRGSFVVLIQFHLVVCGLDLLRIQRFRSHAAVWYTGPAYHRSTALSRALRIAHSNPSSIAWCTW